MQDNLPNNPPTPESTDSVPNPDVSTKSVADVSASESAGASVSNNPQSSSRMYIFAAVIVAIIASGLYFMMSHEGRLTGDDVKPVALVNDVEITNTDYQNSLTQLKQLATSQGQDVTDLTLVGELETQALDTLVNSELLRQAALEQGLSVTPEQIQTRYEEISAGIGGTEELELRMAEFGITTEILMRDIENELLIQNLFELEIVPQETEISDEEVTAFYEELGGEAAGLPAFEEVEPQIVEQLRQNQQNELVSDYIEELRTDAEIEVLL
jgi:peptidyl-prolyl cis-trans isomerase SurA